MNNSPVKPHPLWLSKSHWMALALGLFLGQGVSFMALQRPDNWLGFAVALVFVMSSSASFVLFMLGQRGRQTVQQKVDLVYGFLAMIGIGLLASMRAYELFL